MIASTAKPSHGGKVTSNAYISVVSKERNPPTRMDGVVMLNIYEPLQK